MSVKFNPLSGTFDLVDPMATGSTVIGGNPNAVLFLDSSSALQTDTGFVYTETLVGNVEEASLTLNKTVSRSNIDIGNYTYGIYNRLVTSDSILINNDGTLEYGAGYNYLLFSNSIEASGAAMFDLKVGGFNRVANSSAYTINSATSDYFLDVAACYNSASPLQITIGASTDSPNIAVYGSYNAAFGAVTNNGTGTPFIKYVGVYGYGVRSSGAAANLAIGGEFTGTGATANYGITASGSTAAVYASGHYLVSANNVYDLGATSTKIRKVWTTDCDVSTKLTLPGATGLTNSVVIGGDVELYRDTANRLAVADRFSAVPASYNSTSGSWVGIGSTVTGNPSGSSTGRIWGMQFTATANGANNWTDATSGVTGFEGFARNGGSGTVTALRGGIIYGSNNSTGVCTDIIGVLSWIENNNATGSIGTATVIRASAYGGTNNNVTAHRGVRAGNPAFTANNQTRLGFMCDAMPDPGAFTGTTCFAFDIQGTSRATRDGIRFAQDSEAVIYSSAADTVSTVGGFVANESGMDADFRVEGDTLTHMIFVDATAATENIALLAGSAPGWNSMDGGIFIANATTVPTGNPTGGGYLYVEAGALKWRGSSGTITTLGAA